MPTVSTSLRRMLPALTLGAMLALTGCTDNTECPDGFICTPSTGITADAGDAGGGGDGTTGTPDGTTVDDARTDNGGGGPDVNGQTDVPAEPGEFSYPCQSNADCNSGWCVEGEDGYICTKTCDETCPSGYDCKGVSSGGADLVFLCVPRFQKLCVPCSDDLQCNGGRCMQIDGEGQCTFSCNANEADSCPDGFDCLADGDNGEFCMPATGSCTCTPDTAGAQRGCESSNDIGTCTGFETCDPTAGGWTGCTAPTPAVEDCDGGDNDCDGFIDEDLPQDEACENTVDGIGTCTGVRVCQGINGWICQGPQPSVETCDFQDNDCDGEIDEDFKAGDTYQSNEHCGTCNLSCDLGFPNAKTTECLVFGQTPQCAVAECEDGFVKANDFQCLPDAASICQPCATDANCLGSDSECVALAEGNFCGQTCTSVADCPQGYSCQTVPDAATQQCVPTSGSCSCDGSNLELQRSCSETFTPPAPQPEYTCTGFEQCTANGWGSCTLPTEECDAVDNNCDGQVDEGFVNGSGVYDKVEHCGGCNISCLALGFQDATPSCDISGAVPQCTFTCNPPYQDVDGIPTNGCECLPQPGDDLAGDGIDSNCDGIDGEVGNGIFVAKDGDDGNSGSIDEPKLTIAAALTAANMQNKRDIYVATGVYSENIVLVNGKGLFGGYSPDFRDRDTTTQETAILGDVPSGNEAGTITAAGLGNSGNAKTIVDGFTIFGFNAANQPGDNSYAIYLSDCGPNVEITNNRIFGGAGGNGGLGSGGTDGGDGSNGGNGVDSVQTSLTCAGSDETDGGSGGSNSCNGTNVSGGDGGDSNCPNYDIASYPNGNWEDNVGQEPPGANEAGASGAGSGGGAGGSAGWDGWIALDNSLCGTCSVGQQGAGTPGANGTEGTDGIAGNGCTNGAGSVVGGQWRGLAGSDGADGSNGAGGGGGGSGRGVLFQNDCHFPDNDPPFLANDFLGGTGGGGGAGGCRGTNGQGGEAGGGSFGIFMTYSSSTSNVPVVANNVIRRGAGGQGGTGGPGGSGGLPGLGGDGGDEEANFCCGTGGTGGDGGRGGHGGGGGGGCGGASYGIYAHNANGVGSYNSSNTFEVGGTGGAGGQGGPSLGNSGGAGVAGAAADTNF